MGYFPIPDEQHERMNKMWYHFMGPTVDETLAKFYLTPRCIDNIRMSHRANIDGSFNYTQRGQRWRNMELIPVMPPLDFSALGLDDAPIDNKIVPYPYGVTLQYVDPTCGRTFYIDDPMNDPRLLPKNKEQIYFCPALVDNKA